MKIMIILYLCLLCCAIWNGYICYSEPSVFTGWMSGWLSAITVWSTCIMFDSWKRNRELNRVRQEIIENSILGERNLWKYTRCLITPFMNLKLRGRLQNAITLLTVIALPSILYTMLQRCFWQVWTAKASTWHFPCYALFCHHSPITFDITLKGQNDGRS